MKQWTIMTCALALWAFSGSAWAVTDWGAHAGTSTAGSCPSYCTGPWAFDSDGGANSSSAHSLLDNSSGQAEAYADLSGSTYLPILRARGYSNDRTRASATAVGVQGFTFNGASSQDLTLSFDLHGTDGGAGSDDYVTTDIAVILGSDLPFYTHYSTLIYEIVPLTDGLSLLASNDTLRIPEGTTDTVSDSLTFTLNPGDTFFVWAGLYASGTRGGYGDAYNTFTMDFDDDSNLQASSAVPEPSTYALFGLGLLGMLMASRKKRV